MERMLLGSQFGNLGFQIDTFFPQRIGHRLAENEIQALLSPAHQRHQLTPTKYFESRFTSDDWHPAGLKIQKPLHQVRAFWPVLKCALSPKMHHVISLIIMSIMYGGQKRGLSLDPRWRKKKLVSKA